MTTQPRTLRTLIKFWFTPKKYVSKKIYFSGKMRRVTGETLDYIFLEGIKTGINKTLLENYGIFKS